MSIYFNDAQALYQEPLAREIAQALSMLLTLKFEFICYLSINVSQISKQSTAHDMVLFICYCCNVP